jgi:fructose-specific phosphotransferase system IIC component
MLSLDSFLIPILGGFVFVKYCYLTRFRAIRDNGYVILFKAAIFGYLFYGISFVFWRASLLDNHANPKIPEWIDSLHEFLIYPELAPAILSVILLLFILFAFNYIVDEDEKKMGYQ